MKAAKILLSLLIIFLIGAGAFYAYMGGFQKIEVTRSKFGPVEIIYAQHRGPYKELGVAWSQFQKQWEAAGLKRCESLAIYLDPPGTPEDKLRSILGCQLDGLSEEQQAKLKAKLPTFVIPASQGFASTFPYKNMLSFFLGPKKVYPEFQALMKRENVKEPVAIEVYGVEGEIEGIWYFMSSSLGVGDFGGVLTISG